jgi:hypothetical protein
MKKAILIGSIADGFRLDRVVRDAEAEDVVVASLANGTLAEAIDVQRPSSLSKSARDCEHGEDYVVFGAGLGNGVEIYGPFESSDDACAFGESCRGTEEWEHFVVNSGPSAQQLRPRGQ